MITGEVRDVESGQSMPFATITADSATATASNEAGEFKLELSKGYHRLTIGFIGYQTQIIQGNFLSDTSISVSLNADVRQLREVIVQDEAFYGQDMVERNQMSKISLSPKEMSMLPTIAGETDVIKVAQLLPGISKGFEGTNDYFVRGGDADQNLVLLDGATVYNTGHLFGFLSVFNPDVLGDVSMTTGGFSADQGGRLSSVLDIKTASGQADSAEVAGSVGIIASRIAYRTPLVKDKVTLTLGARRTYIDQVLRTLEAEVQVPYFFYDVNGRLDYRINEKHNLWFSSYFGADVLDFSRLDESQRGNSNFNSNFNLVNSIQSLGWDYRINPKNRLETTLARTDYSYHLSTDFENNSIDIKGAIEDFALKSKWVHYFENKSKLTTGYEGIIHRIPEASLTSTGVINEFVPSSQSRPLLAQEHAVFLSYDKNLSEKLNGTIGLRQSMGIADGKTYLNAEPRAALRYTLNEVSSLKWSYSRMTQYLHRVSSSAISLPTDIWYSITENIAPQTADQIALGYTRTFPKVNTLLTIEGYYKNMNNLTEYLEGTNLLLTADFESQLVQGKGNSYGTEVLLRHEGGRFQGLASYTLSWTNRRFEQLNNGNLFPAKYDRRHSVSLVGQYSLTERWTFTAVWEYLSGARFTPVVGQYLITNPGNSGVELIPIYTARNAVSMSSTHRLDVGLIFKSKPQAKFKSEWHFSVYNLYNRANPTQVIVTTNPETGALQYVQPGLFGLLPSVAYHFRF